MTSSFNESLSQFFQQKIRSSEKQKMSEKTQSSHKKEGKPKAKIIQQKSIGSYSHAPEGGVGKAHQSELV